MGPAEEDLRTELRAWIADHDPGPPPAEYGERIEALTRWQAALCEAGFMGLSWPVHCGGRGMSLAAEAVLAEELARSGAAELINRLALYTWGPTLMDLGEPSQLERFLPGMLDASELWCQGFSEPDAGSDLAGVRTRAEVDGDELVVTGQKVWTSRAELSTWNALLVRTDGEPGQHAGLTLLITNMKSDGVTIRPLPQMLGEPHFSEVFFDEVRVPVANVLGGINEGWRVSMKAMGYERGIFVLERSIRLRRRLSELAGRVRASGGADRAALAGVGRIHASLEMLTAQAYRTLAHQQAGTLLPGATSVDKLYLAEVYQDLFATAAEILGPEVTLADDGWTHDLLESRSVSIYSGTSEIQKNIIVGRLLGIR
ncbi:MAG: acyl-CoA dehydrogenase family protein [bacterium]|nr:acyl-CoA dehydrogenase family protein [bacterium]